MSDSDMDEQNSVAELDVGAVVALYFHEEPADANGGAVAPEGTPQDNLKCGCRKDCLSQFDKADVKQM